MLFGQRITINEFRELSLENKVEYYFDNFVGIPHRTSHSLWAGTIVSHHGKAVVPYIKEQLKTATYFTYREEPIDDTLSLIAYILSSLNRASLYPQYYLSSGVPEFILYEEEIRWFYNEYMKRINEYVLLYRIIDENVMLNMIHISFIARNQEDLFQFFGYPYYRGIPVNLQGNEMKKFFEERLGIQNLLITIPYIE